jgi:hypothetical protein
MEKNIYIYIYILSNSSNDGIECDLTQCEKMGKKWNPFNNTSDIVVSWTSISNWLTYTRWFIRPIWFWVKILYTCRSHHWRTSYIRIVLLGMFALSWQILRTAYFPSLPLHQLDQPQYFEIFWVKLAHSWWTEEKNHVIWITFLIDQITSVILNENYCPLSPVASPRNVGVFFCSTFDWAIPMIPFNHSNITKISFNDN